MALAAISFNDETKGCTTGCEGRNTCISEITIGADSTTDDILEVTIALSPELACCETVRSITEKSTLDGRTYFVCTEETHEKLKCETE